MIAEDADNAFDSTHSTHVSNIINIVYFGIEDRRTESYMYQDSALLVINFILPTNGVNVLHTVPT